MLNYNRSRGAIFVELALILPLVLAFIFFVIWFTVLNNAKYSLKTAVINGARLAITRGTPSIFHCGSGVSGSTYASISSAEVEAVLEYVCDDETEELEKFLIFPEDSTVPLTEYRTFDSNLISNCSGASVAKVSDHILNDSATVQYILALVYITESMKESLGNSVRFPCSPSETDKSGCLRCYTKAMQTADVCAIPKDLDYLGIECEYTSVGAMSTFFGLLDMYTGGNTQNKLFTIKSDAYYTYPVNSWINDAT